MQLSGINNTFDHFDCPWKLWFFSAHGNYFNGGETPPLLGFNLESKNKVLESFPNSYKHEAIWKRIIIHLHLKTQDGDDFIIIILYAIVILTDFQFSQANDCRMQMVSVAEY